MCGRFAQFNPNIEDKFQAKPKKNTGELFFNYNFSPGNQIKAIVKEDARYIVVFNWGIITDWTIERKLNLINIRSDTLLEKKSFQDLFQHKRCLILTDGFFEWMKTESTKIPFYITMKNKETFAFAGLWNNWTSPKNEEIHSCAIITTEANELVKPIHSRMPVIIPENKYDLWLDNTVFNKDELAQLFKPYPVEDMECYEVTRKVNYTDSNSSDLIRPVINDKLL